MKYLDLKNNIHVPIMKKEVIKYMNIHNNGGIYIDGTFGEGGHSKEILSKIGYNGKLIAVDKDPDSIFKANKILDRRFYFKNCSFSLIPEILKNLNILGKVDGILLDLGLSTYQIFNSNRGFTYKKNEILDMRFNNNEGIKAHEWINTSKSKDIEFVFKNFGNEHKYSKKISNYIVQYRKKKYIKYTYDFINIINIFYKNKKKYNIYSKYFQAIRIFINNELLEIEKILNEIKNILKINGRLLIIVFNSLEHNVVKKCFNIKNYNIIDVPITYEEEKNIYKINHEYYMKKIKKITPSKDEIMNNNKSRNAILIIFEKKTT